MSEQAAAVTVEQVTHRFGKVVALDDVSLTFRQGEFVTMLGPSGCGKTTLLRIIAGFERPTAGRVLLGGADITRVAAHRRPLNMVFQRPTLFPHLDVADNVAFGLRVAGVERSQRDSRVAEALRLVRLEGYGKRRADELSGGQMQRIALARALVNRPRVLLLDEPLSALDLKIRLDMEVELRRIHRESGATFVYVTHDQREALALSDRVVVFNEGRVDQVGTPDEIYHQPASPFAARFVGDANVLPVHVTSVDGGQAEVSIGGERLVVKARGDGARVGPAWLVVRAEVVRLAEDGWLRGSVRDGAFRGTGFTYQLDVAGLDEPFKAEVTSEGQAMLLPLGSEIGLQWHPSACVLLEREEEA
jgi:ABC-type Fe3+/spermidine/putrescine transport system ATPase subunit